MSNLSKQQYCVWTRLADIGDPFQTQRVQFQAGCNGLIARGVEPIYPDFCPGCSKPVKIKPRDEAPLTSKEQTDFQRWNAMSNGKRLEDWYSKIREIERLQKSIDRCGTEEGVCYAVELERKDKEIERLRRLEDFAKTIYDTFIRTEEQGYHTRDRQYVIDMLKPVLSGDSSATETSCRYEAAVGSVCNKCGRIHDFGPSRCAECQTPRLCGVERECLRNRYVRPSVVETTKHYCASCGAEGEPGSPKYCSADCAEKSLETSCVWRSGCKDVQRCTEAGCCCGLQSKASAPVICDECGWEVSKGSHDSDCSKRDQNGRIDGG